MGVELCAERYSGGERGIGVKFRVDLGRKGRNERSILGREGSVRSGSGKKWRNERRILGGERCG